MCPCVLLKDSTMCSSLFLSSIRSPTPRSTPTLLHLQLCLASQNLCCRSLLCSVSAHRRALLLSPPATSLPSVTLPFVETLIPPPCPFSRSCSHICSFFFFGDQISLGQPNDFGPSQQVRLNRFSSVNVVQSVWFMSLSPASFGSVQFFFLFVKAYMPLFCLALYI